MLFFVVHRRHRGFSREQGLELRQVHGVPRFPTGGGVIAVKEVGGGVSREGFASAETVKKGREDREGEEEDGEGSGGNGYGKGIGGGG